MARLTYSEQLKHPNWQRRRLETLERHGWQCSDCGDADKTLHVHHKHYFKGRMAWEYSDDELTVLCESCHSNQHRIEDLLKEVLMGQEPVFYAPLLAGLHRFEVDPGVIEELRQANPLSFAVGVTANLLGYLDINELYEVAQFAVSKTQPHAEARMLIERDKSFFGKDA